MLVILVIVLLNTYFSWNFILDISLKLISLLYPLNLLKMAGI